MTTPSRPLLEVIACTVEDAVAAEAGGADRIELVRDLGRGGLTPTHDLAASVVRAVRIPVRVMIREEEPFVVSRPEAAEALCAAARAIGQLKVDGLVLGFLDSSGAVDDGAARPGAERGAARSGDVPSRLRGGGRRGCGVRLTSTLETDRSRAGDGRCRQRPRAARGAERAGSGSPGRASACWPPSDPIAAC